MPSRPFSTRSTASGTKRGSLSVARRSTWYQRGSAGVLAAS
jgi:hypothetical protein